MSQIMGSPCVMSSRAHSGFGDRSPVLKMNSTTRKPGIFTDVKNEPQWVSKDSSSDENSSSMSASDLEDQQMTQEPELGAGLMLRTSVSTEQNSNGGKAAKLPPISAFGILDIRKPVEHEIRLGQVSNDCLVRINTYSTALGGSSTYSSSSATQSRSLSSASQQQGSFLMSYPQSNTQAYQQLVSPVEQQPVFPVVYDRSQLHDQGLNYLASMAVANEVAPAPLTYMPAYMAPQHPLSTPICTNQYPCRYPGCNKAFPTRSRLTRHEIVHQGQKNFQCTYPGCPKRFSRKDNMLQHYRNHSHNPQRED